MFACFLFYCVCGCVCVCALLRCQTNSVCDGQLLWCWFCFWKKRRCSHFGKHLGTCWLNGAAFTVGMKFNDSVFKCIIYIVYTDTVQACPGFKTFTLNLCPSWGFFKACPVGLTDSYWLIDYWLIPDDRLTTDWFLMTDWKVGISQADRAGLEKPHSEQKFGRQGAELWVLKHTKVALIDITTLVGWA